MNETKKIKEELQPDEMKYGLIAVDKRDIVDDDNKQIAADKILCFFGYEEKPTCNDIEDMRAVVFKDPLFKNIDALNHIGIYDAPKNIIKFFKENS